MLGGALFGGFLWVVFEHGHATMRCAAAFVEPIGS
jgi:hypothetical protein